MRLDQGDYLVEGYPLSMTVIRFSPGDVFVQGRLVQDDGLKIEKETRELRLVPFNYETRHRRQPRCELNGRGTPTKTPGVKLFKALGIRGRL